MRRVNYHDFVRDQLALLHHLLGLFANRSADAHGFTEHVARGQVADAKALLDERRLGSLAAARWTNENHVQRLLRRRHRSSSFGLFVRVLGFVDSHSGVVL